MVRPAINCWLSSAHACSGSSCAVGNVAKQVCCTCNASCVTGTAESVAYIVGQTPSCQLTLLIVTLVALKTFLNIKKEEASISPQHTMCMSACPCIPPYLVLQCFVCTSIKRLVELQTGKKKVRICNPMVPHPTMQLQNRVGWGGLRQRATADALRFATIFGKQGS